jgi:hypothetical protein
LRGKPEQRKRANNCDITTNPSAVCLKDTYAGSVIKKTQDILWEKKCKLLKLLDYVQYLDPFMADEDQDKTNKLYFLTVDYFWIRHQ